MVSGVDSQSPQVALCDSDARSASGSSELEVTVLMPCLDEAETLGVCIDKAHRGLADAGIAGEVLIADNGSTDGSQQICVAHGARVVPVERKGYGSALRGGIAAARGRYVIFADADDSYDFLQVPAFVQRLREGDDLVMGNRFRGRIHPGAMPWKHRWIGNPVLSWIGRVFYRVPVGDFHCGLRGFSKSAYERMGLRTTGMEFASEMVIKATLQGLQITEIPTELRPDGRSRAPHLRSWRDGWRHLRFMLLLCPRWLFLIPGTLLLILGTFVMVGLLGGTIRVGPAGFDIHSMLVALLAAVVGGQLVIFAIFAQRLAVLLGLHPARSVGRNRRPVSLETGVIVGGGLALIGLGVLLWQAVAWQQRGFGPVDPQVMMRRLIPAAGMVAMGTQLIFGSFFLSFLGIVGNHLPRRESVAS